MFKLILWGGTGLILFAFLLMFLFDQFSGNVSTVEEPQREIIEDSPEVEERVVSQKPGGEPVVVIGASGDRIPDDFNDRLQAAPMELLPHRAGYPEADSSDLAVPADEQAKLTELTRRFLTNWESFKLTTKPKAYRERLQRYVTPGALDAIVKRTEAGDEPGVCFVRADCTAATKLADGALPSAHIVDYDGQHAYATTFAPVRYIGWPDMDPRVGQVRQRAYGLIFVKSGSKWLVERAVAETLDPETPTFEVDEAPRRR